MTRTTAVKPTLSPLAASVRAELRARELTQERISQLLGIHQTAVGLRMRGTRPWLAHELLKLSDEFDIPLERLYRSDIVAVREAS